MKYSVALILWTNDQTVDGAYPIYLRITIDRKTVYIATGKFAGEKYWSAKDEQLRTTHPDHGSANPELTSLKAKTLQIIAKHQVDGKRISAKDLKKMITAGRDLTNIFDFADEFYKSVENKRDDSTLSNYTKHMRKLEEFNGSRSLFFEDITEKYLTDYENHLLKPYELKSGEKRVISDAYRFMLLRAIRTLFNAARKKGVTTHYPFLTFEMPEVNAKKKEHLTLAELKKLEHFFSTTNKIREKQSSLWFLFGCYSGLRVSDWYQFSHEEHVRGSRIYLRADKNNEWISMPISAPLKRIIELTKVHKITVAEQHINETLKDIAGKLGIKKKLTTHCARHTFAVTICLERGISSETAAELMGITLKTFVENYSKVTARKIDKEAMSAWEGL